MTRIDRPMSYLSAFARHPLTRRAAQYGTPAGNLTPAQIHSLEAYYGLNKPAVVQYFDWLGGLFTGNLGVDVTTRQSVASMTGQALPNTIELAVLSIMR